MTIKTILDIDKLEGIEGIKPKHVRARRPEAFGVVIKKVCKGKEVYFYVEHNKLEAWAIYGAHELIKKRKARKSKKGRETLE